MQQRSLRDGQDLLTKSMNDRPNKNRQEAVWKKTIKSSTLTTWIVLVHKLGRKELWRTDEKTRTLSVNVEVCHTYDLLRVCIDRAGQITRLPGARPGCWVHSGTRLHRGLLLLPVPGCLECLQLPKLSQCDPSIQNSNNVWQGFGESA
jgi:hypothetical protein